MASGRSDEFPVSSDEEEHFFAGFTLEEIGQMMQDRQRRREQESLRDVDEEIDALIDQEPQESASNSDVKVFADDGDEESSDEETASDADSEDAPPNPLQWSNTLSRINVEEFSVRHGPFRDLAADADTYYVPRFQVSLGKNRTNSDLFRRKGLGYYVVWTLGEPYLDNNRHFFFDNFFTSADLMRNLQSRNTYACGTVRQNRKDFPADLKRMKLVAGEVRTRQSGNLVATMWRDKRVVSLLSTNTPPEPEIHALQQVVRGRRERVVPDESM